MSNNEYNTDYPEIQCFFECPKCGALGIYSTEARRDVEESVHYAECFSDDETLANWNGGVR